jgi:hypothetical protein
MLAVGVLLIFSGSVAGIAASIFFFAVSFIMGAVIAASGRLLAGLAILILSLVAAPVAVAILLLALGGGPK